MILLNGVSGFDVPDPTIGMDELFFKKVCYSVILTLDGNIISFNETEIARNYFEAKVNIFNEDLFLLLNHIYPFIAFASNMEEDIQFIDSKKLKSEFDQYYRVLSIKELSEPLEMNEKRGRFIIENRNDLNDAELKNIKYWQSRTVGDVVFNCWD